MELVTEEVLLEGGEMAIGRVRDLVWIPRLQGFERVSLVRNRKQVAETPTGQLKRDCTVRMCEDVLVMLAGFGLLVIDRTAAPPRGSRCAP